MTPQSLVSTMIYAASLVIVATLVFDADANAAAQLISGYWLGAVLTWKEMAK